jgi:hypothetical protein
MAACGMLDGRVQAVPLRHLKTGVAALGHRGHVGQLRQALFGAGGDAAQLARLDVRQDGGRAHAGGFEPAGQQVGELRAGAAVGHVQHEDAGGHLQVFKRQVPGAAVAGRAVVELAGPGLGQRDELLEVVRRHAGVDHVQARHLGQQRDRLEVLVGVEGQLVEDEGVDRHGADVAQDDGVAVGGGRAHSCIAMLPLAPGLFSTNTVWPRLLVSSLAAERATISELPPGAKGTSRRIGLLGQPACACSSPGKAEAAASAPPALRPSCSAPRRVFE